MDVFKLLRVQGAIFAALLGIAAVQTDANAVAQRWAQNLGAASDKIKAGVQGVTGLSPGQRAAQQKVKWLQRLQAAADKWAARVGAITLAEWQTAMIEKGIPRIGQGATAATPKMVAFFSQFLPYVNQAATTVRAMPHVTLEDGINRAVAQIRANAAFQYRKGQA